MKREIEIIISGKAYEKVLELLEEHDEYSCLKFQYSNSCSSPSKIDIILDDIAPNYILQKYKELIVAYDANLESKIEKIELKYESFTFMVKATQREKIEASKCCSSKNCDNLKKCCNRDAQSTCSASNCCSPTVK